MASHLSLDEASEAMRHALQETVRKNSFLFLVQAGLMIFAGLVALIYPLLSSVALAVLLGWLLILMGGAQLISLIGSTRVPHFWLQLLSAALAVLVGFLFVTNPGAAVETLALLMIIFFMIEGMSKIVFSLSVRPLKNWGWVLLSGIVGVLISLFLLSSPALSIVLFGILIGVQLVSEGIAIGWMAWHIRRG